MFKMRYWIILVLAYAIMAIAVPLDEGLESTDDDDTLVDESRCNPRKAEKCLEV